jgi:soluble lytic murein transglycosylase-like protein
MHTLILGWLSRLRLMGLRQPRQQLIAAVAALCIIAVAGTVLAFTLRPAQTVTVERSLRAAATSTLTPTLVPTATNTPHPVATTVPHTPPPPPVPTPPPATPTATPCPTATPTRAPTATPTSAPTATNTPGAAAPAPNTSPANFLAACQLCPYYKGNNPTQPAIQAALFAAADAYRLPRNLLQAVAWQESKWHEDVLSCDGGIGLMQIQDYNVSWLNQVVVPECGLTATNNDPNTLQGNANLGAKYLSYLMCFYSYWGGYAGYSLQNPAPYTIDWYYQQAGLQYPDSTNANGTPNPASLCAAVFNDAGNPEYLELPSTTAQPWSCPYSAKAGDTTLLDITLSAYNEGPGYTDSCGICNPWYVAAVEGFIPQFFSGALPVPS